MTETYTFHCKWSEEDKAFVGTFEGMPSLSWLSLTKRNALRGIVGLVIQAEEDLADSRDYAHAMREIESGRMPMIADEDMDAYLAAPPLPEI